MTFTFSSAAVLAPVGNLIFISGSIFRISNHSQIQPQLSDVLLILAEAVALFYLLLVIFWVNFDPQIAFIFLTKIIHNFVIIKI